MLLHPLCAWTSRRDVSNLRGSGDPKERPLQMSDRIAARSGWLWRTRGWSGDLARPMGPEMHQRRLPRKPYPRSIAETQREAVRAAVPDRKSVVEGKSV